MQPLAMVLNFHFSEQHPGKTGDTKKQTSMEFSHSCHRSLCRKVPQASQKCYFLLFNLDHLSSVSPSINVRIKQQLLHSQRITSSQTSFPIPKAAILSKNC